MTTTVHTAIVRTRDLVRGPLALAEQPAWEHTAITFQHQLKAMPITDTAIDLAIRLGSPARAANCLRPALQHVEALVYRGDLSFEDHQRHGTAADTTWRQGIDAILGAYRLADDSALAGELDTLADYFELETRIAGGLEPLTPDLLHATCYQRSSHIRFLVRLAHHLADLPLHEEFLRLAGHVFARDEITADCVTYASDLAEGSFNTLRLQAVLHGPRGAAEAQRALYARVLGDLDAELAQADRPTLALFGNAFLPRLTRPRRHRHDPDPRPRAYYRAMPPAMLRRHIREQVRRSKRLAPVPVPQAQHEPSAEG
ncbi:hypothetical protein [Streptomyces palmae]|uniref:Squalene/phytoene synthase family protein n=1 Tax=Streptomyces palmae TaxID=1701085 RepID=A0A4Z0FUB0_9ACTN|nr:hypothetical protein [Streptomyces palmae]TGA85625.1 hypothetical protein E4099_30835 [Streptomyces palmae]